MERLDANAPVACSLNDDDFHKRRAFARDHLISRVISVERLPDGALFGFNPQDNIDDELRTFVNLEQQCCGFLTFTLLPIDDDCARLSGLKVQGPANAMATIEMFSQAVQANVQ